MQVDAANIVLPLVNLYAMALDMGRLDLFDEIFTPDLEADFGAGGHWHSRDSFRNHMEQFISGFDLGHHALSNTIWRFDGETGHSLTTVDWLIVRKNMPGGEWMRGKGWYQDRIVRTGAGWRINKRSFELMRAWGNLRIPQPDSEAEFPIRSMAEAAKEGIFSEVL